MSTNPYFAYSIKSGYSGNVAQPGISSLPRPPKKKSRACDVCSIRKTKCDDARPCGHCVANNLKCTELRERKKSGPKSLRKKTIETINSVSKESSKSPTLLSPSHSASSNSSLPDISSLVHELSTYSAETFRECVPFTVPSMASDLPLLFPCLLDIHKESDNRIHDNVKAFAVASLTLVLMEILRVFGKSVKCAGSSEDIQSHVSTIRSVCNESLLFDRSGENPDFDIHYYLALAELHLFSYLLLQAPHNNQKLVHLRAAITHCQSLEVYFEDNGLLVELRRTLFVWERHTFFFTADRVFRTAGIILHPINDSIQVTPTTNSLLDSYYEMLQITDSVFKSGHPIPELFTWQYETSPSSVDSEYPHLKARLSQLQAIQYGISSQEYAVYTFMNLAVRFKLLLAYSGEHSRDFVAKELLAILDETIALLGGANVHLKYYMNKFAYAIQLSEFLAAFLAVNANATLSQSSMDTLLRYSTILSVYKEGKPNTWVDEPALNAWFAQLSNQSK